MSGIRQRLLAGEAVVGSWINSCSPVVAELMAAAGFDFLAVDAEHSPVDVPQAQALFQAVRSGNPSCEAMVRLPDGDYATIKRYLDAGAGGVIAPLINTAAQAAEVVQAVKYPPQGRRGVGFCRANAYGMALESAVAKANDETLVCVQIEHVDGVRNIDEILSVEGVDAVFIGPYDLSASMGITAQFDRPEMAEATDKILAACRSHSVVAGIHVVQPDAGELLRRYKEGYRLLAYSLDITMLTTASHQGLAEIRRGIGRED